MFDGGYHDWIRVSSEDKGTDITLVKAKGYKVRVTCSRPARGKCKPQQSRWCSVVSNIDHELDMSSQVGVCELGGNKTFSQSEGRPLYTAIIIEVCDDPLLHCSRKQLLTSLTVHGNLYYGLSFGYKLRASQVIDSGSVNIAYSSQLLNGKLIVQLSKSPFKPVSCTLIPGNIRFKRYLQLNNTISNQYYLFIYTTIDYRPKILFLHKLKCRISLKFYLITILLLRTKAERDPVFLVSHMFFFTLRNATNVPHSYH